jgi:transcriptional regulator with XRE-family HTH domain
MNELQKKIRKLKQGDIATMSDLSVSAVSRILSGGRDPQLSTLKRLREGVNALTKHEYTLDEIAEAIAR